MSYKIFINGIDKTNNIQRGSVKIVDALNNRRDTLAAQTVDLQVAEGQELIFFEGSNLSAQANSAQNQLVVIEIFSDTNKFRAGDILYIDPYGTLEKRTIQSVNTATNTITLTANLSSSHAQGIFIGKRTFGGVILQAPDAEIGQSGKFEDTIQVVDYSNLLDRKIIAQNYVNRYPREIVGRVIYEFCADDSDIDVFTFEPSIDQSQETITTNYRVGDTGGTEYQQAQSFVPTKADLVAVKLRKTSTTGALANDLTISIYSGAAGSPGALITSTTITNAVWFSIVNGSDFYAAISATLTPAATYWIVISTAANPNNTGFEIGGRGTGTGRKYSIDGGATWSAGTFDLKFETFYTNIVWTGVAIKPAVSTTDNLQGNFSLYAGASGVGTATYTQTFTPVILSGKTHFRFWFGLGKITDELISSAKVRLGTDASNFYEWTITNLDDEIWSWDSFEFSLATITGSPNMASIGWLQFNIVATGAIASGNIKFDHALSSTGGFTIKNVQNGDPSTLFSDVRVQYKKPTVFLESLAKMLNWFWYVDYERDIHFFSNTTYTSPEIITDISQNYAKLSISVDITQIKNRQTLQGGIAPDEILYTQTIVCDGKGISWALDYPPSGLTVYEDRGATGTFTQKTLGVDNFSDVTTIDYVMNFNEKVVKQASASLMSANDVIRFTYYPYRQIMVRYQDKPSITAMKALTGGDGIYDGAVIMDSSIKTFSDARTRTMAEVNQYKNPILTATFDSNYDGWRSGQLVTITDTTRSVIAQQFLIQQVSKKSTDTDRFVYTVQAGSTLFGITEFFQLLLAQSIPTIDGNALLNIIDNIDEVMKLNDFFTFRANLGIFYATGAASSANPRDGFAEFSEVCGTSPDGATRTQTAT